MTGSGYALPARIFREYDIRGQAEGDLVDPLVEDLGRALGTMWQRRGCRRVALARDCRLSSDRLHAALGRGLASTGTRIVDVGVGPTPLMYFAVFEQNLDGGVMITGSHNPPGDNGFKIMAGKAALFGSDIQQLHKLMQQRDFVEAHPSSPEHVDLTEAYARHSTKGIALEGNVPRFAVDAGNGAGGPLCRAAMGALGLNPTWLLCEMDGRFPAHHPDPSEEANLELLRQTVREQKLDFGVAFDGDADRLGVVDAEGSVLWGDRLLTLFARDILRDHPGASVIGEVKCSQTLYDDIAERGGKPIVWKTGHSLLKAKMKETGALLAGEMSGHLFFADRNHGYDDAIYAALRLVELVAKSGQSLAALGADIPKTFATPEIRLPCPEERKFAVVEAALTHFRARGADVLTIDGARIKESDGWGLVRASNTQAVLVMRFEARSPEGLQRLREDIEGYVRSLVG